MPLTFALLLHKFVVLLLSAHHLPLTKPLKPKAFSNKHTNIQLQCQMMFSRHKLSISFTQLFFKHPYLTNFLHVNRTRQCWAVACEKIDSLNKAGTDYKI